MPNTLHTTLTLTPAQLRLLQTLVHEYYIDTTIAHDRLQRDAAYLRRGVLQRSAATVAEAVVLLDLVYPN
jgi:hypothetical protein